MLNFFLKLLKYGCPILLIAVSCFVGIGMMAPWPVAEKALGTGWSRESILIGISYEARFSGKESFKRRTQTYLGLPSSTRAFRIISVIQENGEIRTEEAWGGLLSFVATYVALAAGTWWFWIRPRKTRPSARQ